MHARGERRRISQEQAAGGPDPDDSGYQAGQVSFRKSHQRPSPIDWDQEEDLRLHQ